MDREKKEKILKWLKEQVEKHGDIKYSKMVELSKRAEVGIPMIFSLMTRNSLMSKLNNDLEPSE